MTLSHDPRCPPHHPKFSPDPHIYSTAYHKKYNLKFISFIKVLYLHFLLSIEILIKNSIDSHPGQKYIAHEQPMQVGRLFSLGDVSRLRSFLSAFRCMEKDISFFLTGDLQITFLRNKSSWPKMTGNYWAIKHCARPLMHRSGIWFIKKKEKKKSCKKDRVARPDRSEWPGQMLTLQPKQLLLQGLHCLLEKSYFNDISKIKNFFVQLQNTETCIICVPINTYQFIFILNFLIIYPWMNLSKKWYEYFKIYSLKYDSITIFWIKQYIIGRP